MCFQTFLKKDHEYNEYYTPKFVAHFALLIIYNDLDDETSNSAHLKELT